MGAAEKREMKQVLTDIIDAIAYVINGEPHNPKRFARTPPKGWHTATPEGNVPARKSKAVEVDLNAYTPEEILAMTEAEYGQKIGLLGVHSWQESRKEAQKQIAKKSRGSNAKPVEIEL